MSELAITLCGGLGGGVLLYVLHTVVDRHRRYCLLAEMAKTWHLSGVQYADSLQHLHRLVDDTAPGDLQRFLKLWIKHDQENFHFCVREYNRFSTQIPSRLRARYLGVYA